MLERRMADDGLIMGRITDESVGKMRQRIGFPNPTLRHGWLDKPHNIYASYDAFRRFAIYNGSDNPLFIDEDYPQHTRWGESIAPLGFEGTMGLKRPKAMEVAFERETRGALRGVQLFHSGGENFYFAPITSGQRLYVSRYVSSVEVKESRFGGQSVIVGNGKCYWNDDDTVLVQGTETFVHVERRRSSAEEATPKAKAETIVTSYSDEDLAAIEAAYDAEFRRGANTWYLEDIAVGTRLPTMVKGPLTITDLINFFMGAGWYSYGAPPFRLAYENRKRIRGFYSKNEYQAWDTIQRIHWEASLLKDVGVAGIYDVAVIRQAMLNHYCNNIAGDDAWVYRVKYDLRKFNYIGDTTWVNGVVTEARVDQVLGPLVEIDLSGVNQRGEENIRGSATILVASHDTGLAKLPPPAQPTVHRADDWRMT
jgi:hypothetical protein